MARPFITNYNWTTVDKMDMLDIGGGNGGGNMWTKGGGTGKNKIKITRVTTYEHKICQVL